MHIRNQSIVERRMPIVVSLSNYSPKHFCQDALHLPVCLLFGCLSGLIIPRVLSKPRDLSRTAEVLESSYVSLTKSR